MRSKLVFKFVIAFVIFSLISIICLMSVRLRVVKVSVLSEDNNYAIDVEGNYKYYDLSEGVLLTNKFTEVLTLTDIDKILIKNEVNIGNHTVDFKILDENNKEVESSKNISSTHHFEKELEDGIYRLYVKVN